MNLLRGWLLDNLGLKLTALLLAVLVYLNVYTDRPNTMVVSFPLEFTDLPDSLALSGPAPSVVQAELGGTGKQLILLRLKEPRLRLSMSGASAGHFSRALAPTDLPLPPGGGLTVENLVGPRVVEVDIDRRSRRDVPVRVKVEGAPAAGYYWNGVAIAQPKVVQVSGPRSAIAKLDTLDLQPVRIDGRRDSIHVEAPILSLPDWCTADPPSVHVRLGFVRR
jgi:hypothetical protein